MKSSLPSRFPDSPAIIVCGLAATWCVVLWAARAVYVGYAEYFYFVYNLALAAIPLLLSTVAIRLRSRWHSLLVLVPWLLFFPNAPYLMTDLIHLRPRPHEAPFWFDWLFMLSCAGTGLITGLVSLFQVRMRLASWWGTFRAEFCLLGILALTGFGIYLGRFPRWNSWDLFLQPFDLSAGIIGYFLNPAEHPRMLAFSLGVTFVLWLSYLGIRACALLQSVPTPRPIPPLSEKPAPGPSC